MLIFRLIQRHISRRRFQSLLFVVGVALGVAVGLAIDLANTSAKRAFTISTESITGSTTHQIVGGPSGLDASIYNTVRDDLGITRAAPVIEAPVRAVNMDERALRFLGVDTQVEEPFRDYLSADQVLLDESFVDIEIADEILELFTPVLISERLAAEQGFSIGDILTLRINVELVDAQIVGLLQPDDSISQEALDDIVATDLRVAQRLFDMDGRISRLDLILEDDQVVAVESILPAGVILTTPAQRSNTLDQMTEAFEINLQALSLLALVVGIFLIYNTVMFSVVQRRNVIGIMRSLGTSKRQIFRMVLGEAFILGTVGTAFGLLMGIIMAQGTVGAISQSVNDLYFRVNVETVTITPMSILRGVAVGVAASVLAAVIPSIEATRTTPAGSMRRSDFEQSALKLVPYITAVGISMIIGGVLVLQLNSTNLILSFTGLFLVIVGAAFFTPLGMVTLSKMLTPVTGALFGVLGRMAPRALVRSLSRTAIAVAALTLSVSVIVGVGVMISSFRTTVVSWLDLTLGADIFISTPSASTDSDPNIDPALEQRLAEVPGVVDVPVVRTADVLSPTHPDLPPVQIVAIDTDLTGGKREFVWRAQDDYLALLEQGQVMVSEPFAFRRDITPENNTITLITDNGEQAFTVLGVFYDYTSDQGSLWMTLDTYRQFYDDPYLTSMAVTLAPNADLSEVRELIRTDALAGYDFELQSNRELRDSALEVFDRTFSITIALQILATIVAFIGILSALMALQLENIREYGIMRATGMTPGQLRQFTFIQTGLMGVISGILAIPIGVALAYILISVINVRSFGWSMNMQLQPQEFIQAFGVALIAALLAGVYPAWRISRIQPAAALRNE